MALATNSKNKNLFNLAGLQSAPAAVKTALIADAVELLEKRLLLKILDRLSPSDEEKFLELLDGGTGEERQIFLARAVPDFPALIDAEVVRIKDEVRAFATV